LRAVALGENKKKETDDKAGCKALEDPTRRQMLKKLLYIPPIVTSLILSREASAQSTCMPLCPGECPPHCTPICTPICSPVCPHN
jgi:hypothetical protein